MEVMMTFETAVFMFFMSIIMGIIIHFLFIFLPGGRVR